MNDLDAAFSAVLADVFRREADHWENEYNALLGEHPSATKAQAAWKLGASILRRRAEQYESGTVRYLHLVPPLADTEAREGVPGKRLAPDFRADLIDFAARRIQDVWNDAGEVSAQVLAENVVAAQEWLWISLGHPVAILADTNEGSNR